MKYFRLIEPIREPQRIMVDRPAGKGHRQYRRLTAYPGELYEVPDEIAEHSIRNAPKGKVKYSVELENTLKEYGIEYETKKCGSCGGGIKSLIYPRFEIIEVEDE